MTMNIERGNAGPGFEGEDWNNRMNDMAKRLGLQTLTGADVELIRIQATTFADRDPKHYKEVMQITTDLSITE